MKVQLTKQAAKDLEEISTYIRQKFGEKHAKELLDSAQNCLSLLAQFPLLGSIQFPERQIRGVQVTALTRAFYVVKPGKVVVLRLRDGRTDWRG